MPNLIAQSILGVQPMTGLTGSIFSMKAQYAATKLKIPLNKQHYKKFLRLYNRRKFTYHTDIIDVGYFMCEKYKTEECIEWCEKNFGKYGFIYDDLFNRFYFENLNDQTLFKMRWL